jgi:hypothetical protein
LQLVDKAFCLSAAKKKEYEAFCSVRQLLFFALFLQTVPLNSLQLVDLLQQFAGRRTIAKPADVCKAIAIFSLPCLFTNETMYVVVKYSFG